MADGKYRVTRAGDGSRYLYLFPPGGGYHASISTDTGETEDREALLGFDGKAFEWSVGGFESLLDELERRQTSDVRSNGGSDRHG